MLIGNMGMFNLLFSNPLLAGAFSAIDE